MHRDTPGVSVHRDICLPFGADRYIFDWATDQFFDIFDIVKRLFGQILRLTAAADVTVPARKRLKDRLCNLERMPSRKMIGDGTADVVRCAYADFF